MIAAECRAAATRIRLAARPAFCYTVIVNEAQRHEALVDGSGFLPAFEAFNPYDDHGVHLVPDRLELQILIRIVTPKSMSTHCTTIGLCKPTEEQIAEVNQLFSLRQRWNRRAAFMHTVDWSKRLRTRLSEIGTQLLSADEFEQIRYETPTRISMEPDLQAPGEVDHPRYAVAREADAAIACSVVSDALVTMAEYVDFLIRSAGLARRHGFEDLSLDARDVLEMLWKLKGFGERSAKPLKQVAPVKMRKRKGRMGPTTIEKAAQMGFKELKSAGFALARQKVGSWLTPEGRELAESAWGSRSKS